MKNSKKPKSKFKRFCIDVISFGSPQAIIFNLSSVFFLLAVTPTSKLGYSPFKCIFKNLIFQLYLVVSVRLKVFLLIAIVLLVV